MSSKAGQRVRKRKAPARAPRGGGAGGGDDAAAGSALFEMAELTGAFDFVEHVLGADARDAALFGLDGIEGIEDYGGESGSAVAGGYRGGASRESVSWGGSTAYDARSVASASASTSSSAFATPAGFPKPNPTPGAYTSGPRAIPAKPADVSPRRAAARSSQHYEIFNALDECIHTKGLELAQFGQSIPKLNPKVSTSLVPSGSGRRVGLNGTGKTEGAAPSGVKDNDTSKTKKHKHNHKNSSKSEAKPKFKPRTRQQFNRDAAAYAMRRKAMGWPVVPCPAPAVRYSKANDPTGKGRPPRLKSVQFDTPERLICDLMCDHVRMRGGPRGREQKIMDKRKSALAAANASSVSGDSATSDNSAQSASGNGSAVSKSNSAALPIECYYMDLDFKSKRNGVPPYRQDIHTDEYFNNPDIRAAYKKKKKKLPISKAKIDAMRKSLSDGRKSKRYFTCDCPNRNPGSFQIDLCKPSARIFYDGLVRPPPPCEGPITIAHIAKNKKENKQRKDALRGIVTYCMFKGGFYDGSKFLPEGKLKRGMSDEKINEIKNHLVTFGLPSEEFEKWAAPGSEKSWPQKFLTCFAGGKRENERLQSAHARGLAVIHRNIRNFFEEFPNDCPSIEPKISVKQMTRIRGKDKHPVSAKQGTSVRPL